MQVTKGTWRMREQCVPGSLSSSPAREPGNKASGSLAQTLLYFVFRSCYQYKTCESLVATGSSNCCE